VEISEQLLLLLLLLLLVYALSSLISGLSQIAWDKKALFCFSVIPGGYIHSVFEDTQ
jgi:hypothetical protein